MCHLREKNKPITKWEEMNVANDSSAMLETTGVLISPSFSWISFVINLASVGFSVFMLHKKVGGPSLVFWKVSDSQHRLRITLLVILLVQRLAHCLMQLTLYILHSSGVLEPFSFGMYTFLNCLTTTYCIAADFVILLFALLSINMYIRMELILPRTYRHWRLVVLQSVLLLA